MSAQYICPQCRERLQDEGDSYFCPCCSRTYPVIKGVPDFSIRSHYWNQLTEAQMSVLLELTESRGYRYAIENVVGLFRDSYLVDYVLGEDRADFRSVLPMTTASKVLDLGAGWGAVSCALGPSCASVTSCDTNPHTLRFLKMRTQQTGLRNIHPVRIDPLDDGRLPFDDNSFDVVVMSGVLEYVGAASLDSSPAEVQRRCLKEVRRVLKPHGTLYVGIENRFGYLYFLGSHDHNGLRFTSLLPRKLAGWITQWRKGTPYRTYTYSSAGYTALLQSAGFQTPEFHLAIPTYREPRYIVPAHNQNAIAYFARQHAYSIKRRVRRVLVSALFRSLPVRVSSALMRQVADSYLILAVPNK